MEEVGDTGNRDVRRRHLMLYLEVYHLESGNSIGRLGDLSRKGILILTEKRLDSGALLTVEIKIPDSLEAGRDSLRMTVEVRWCREDVRPGLFSAGCKIASMAETEFDCMDFLIKKIGFSDGARRIFLKDDRNVFL